MNAQPTRLNSLIIQQAPIGVIVIQTLTGKIIQTNEEYCKIIGRKEEEILGNTWMNFTHPDDIIDEYMCLLEIRETGALRTQKNKRYIRADGQIVESRITLIPLNTDLPELLHIVMVQDISAERRSRQKIQERTREILKTREALMNSMVILAQFRDRETGDHLLRTKNYVKLLLEHYPYNHAFSQHGINMIAHASMLHDIGKVAIPDTVLLKKGRLSKEEFDIMETHTLLGSQAIKRTLAYLEHDAALMFAKEIAEFHHERWDGTGYPHRLSRDQIPLNARLMSLADVYDALRSERPYKHAFTHEESVRIIRSESGTHFDPLLVNLFLHLESRFQEISLMNKKELEELQE